MRALLFELDGEWGWNIFDGYGDLEAESTKMHSSREAARQEMYAALNDFEEN